MVNNWAYLTSEEADIVTKTIIVLEPKQVLLEPKQIWDYLSQVEGQKKGPSQNENRFSITETN